MKLDVFLWVYCWRCTATVFDTRMSSIQWRKDEKSPFIWIFLFNLDIWTCLPLAPLLPVTRTCDLKTARDHTRRGHCYGKRFACSRFARIRLRVLPEPRWYQAGIPTHSEGKLISLISPSSRCSNSSFQFWLFLFWGGSCSPWELEESNILGDHRPYPWFCAGSKWAGGPEKQTKTQMDIALPLWCNERTKHKTRTKRCS